jgi:hypothetical protein
VRRQARDIAESAPDPVPDMCGTGATAGTPVAPTPVADVTPVSSEPDR